MFEKDEVIVISAVYIIILINFFPTLQVQLPFNEVLKQGVFSFQTCELKQKPFLVTTV